MKFLFLILTASFLFLTQCSSSQQASSPEDIANTLREEGAINGICKNEGKDKEECCSEDKECVRLCEQKIFFKSEDKVHRKCKSLPKNIVEDLDLLTKTLETPILHDLERLEVTKEFRLLLVLDYQTIVRIIKTYTVSNAAKFINWLAGSADATEELANIPDEARNEIIYEVLASAGERTLLGPVEEALAKDINSGQTYFKLLIEKSNYELLQMSHDMLKEDICSVDQTGNSNSDLCVLRIYCKQIESSKYVHPEDLRNEIARQIEDKNFFQYVEEDLLGASLGLPMLQPIMNNQVCDLACKGNTKACE